MAKVTVYSTHTCQFCKQEKAYLDEKGVKYDNVFVDDDPAKAQEMVDMSHQMGTPFTVIEKDGGEKANIVGFDKGKIDEVLGL